MRLLVLASSMTLIAAALVSCRGGQGVSSRADENDIDDQAADDAMVDEEWERSARLHREIVQREPENGLAMYHLGFSLGSLGHRREEVEWYERAMRAGYQSPDLLYNLGLARLDLGALTGADSALTAAVAARRAEAEFHYALARVALARGDAKRARTHLERATEIQPRHREAWAALAEVYERSGELEAAAAARARTR